MKRKKIFFKYGLIFSFYFLALIYLTGCQMRKTHYIIGRDPAWESVPLAPSVALTAFTNEVINKMSDRSKIFIAIENCSPVSLLSYLDENKVQGILLNVSPEFIDLEKYSLSFPLIKTGPVLVVSSSSSSSSLKDLQGKFVAVYRYDNSISLIEEREDYIIETYEDPILALNKLEMGFYDGVFLPALEAYSLTSSFFKEKLKIITPPMGDVGIYLMVKKGFNSKLLKSMNSICGSNKRSKTLKSLQEMYLLACSSLNEKVHN